MLLIISVGVIVVGVLIDVRKRPASLETTVRRYFAALEAGDVDSALATLAPPVRDRDVAFVENGAGNRYRIAGIAVREPSLLDRMQGKSAGPTEVTVFLDITQVLDDVRWQAGPTVPVREVAGRWYLARPPLIPPD